VGLDDRDYMRERNRRTFDRLTKDSDRPFAPPPSQPSFVSMALVWVAVALALYKAYGWWEHRKTPHAQPPAYRTQGGEAPRDAEARGEAPPPVAPVARNQTFGAYQAAPAPVESPRPQTGGTIYLCRDYSGGSFWASDHCNQHNALIDRMVSVPAGMPFQQQVALAEQRRQAVAAPATVYTATAAPPASPAPEKALCGSLDARVNQLDAMARQPQSGSTQDWIRQERQKTRDEQFHLRC
jgi:hypothetical protein